MRGGEEGKVHENTQGNQPSSVERERTKKSDGVERTTEGRGGGGQKRGSKNGKNSGQHLFQIQSSGRAAKLVNIISSALLPESLEAPHVQRRSEGEHETSLQLILQSSCNFT